MLELAQPTAEVHVSYLGAGQEYPAEGGYLDFDELDVEEPEQFRAYVQRLRRDPRTVPTLDWPAVTLLWWIDGDPVPGPDLSVWHALTGTLATVRPGNVASRRVLEAGGAGAAGGELEVQPVAASRDEPGACSLQDVSAGRVADPDGRQRRVDAQGRNRGQRRGEHRGGVAMPRAQGRMS